MSFSSEIKDKISAIKNECTYCNISELSAIIRYSGKINNSSIVVTTENESVAKCVLRLIKESFGIDIDYEYKEKSRFFEIDITDEGVYDNICDSLMFFEDKDDSITPFECCRASYIRGAFLGGGSISDPKKSYHLEFATRYSPEADRLKDMLKSLGVGAKITKRKGLFVVYIKDYSGIADVVGLIGDANSALLIYNISIEKDVRNSINRQMNCENANMDKVADAYKKHLAAIEKIKRTIGIDKLPESLQEIAEVRIMYPEDSLKMLGERLISPIGKSGVNHRLNRIVEIAENIEN